jgi:MEMO1 family protein
MNHMTNIRPSPIAGLWYSDNPQRLSREVDDYINRAVLPDLPGQAVAIVAPHAGHRYSGRTAGYAFRALLGGKYDLVIVISPLHRYDPAVFLTSSHQAYSTPLGLIEIDHQAVSEVDAILRAQNAPGLTPIAHDDEHSLEIELPFLQRSLSAPFRLLPIMVRSQSPQDAEALGHALARVGAAQSTILVASTDLSHFYPEPVAQELDAEILRQIGSLSPEGVFKTERTGRGYACGIGALGAVLWAARDLGANAAAVLHHSTSADETGDSSSVVGYGAAVVFKQA